MKLGQCATLGAILALPLWLPMPLQATTHDSFQLYGIVGAVVANDTVTYQGQRYSRSGPRSDLSLYGLRGTHALGDGFTLAFDLENGFSSMTGAGSNRVWAREVRLGLSHPKAGRVDVGRHYNLSALWAGSTDPLGGSYELGGFDTVMMTGSRRDNMMLYRTPVLDGWQAGIGWSPDVDAIATARHNEALATRLPPGEVAKTFNSRNGQRQLDAGVRYAKGPATFVLTYDRVMRRDTDPGYRDHRTIHGYFVGAAYAFDPITVYGQFSQQFGGMMSTKGLHFTPVSDERRMRDFRFHRGTRYDSSMLGVSYETGPHRYMTSWQNMNSMGVVATGDTAQMHVFSLAYRYTLSKRTDIRAYGYVARNFGFVRGLHARTVSLGVRHRF